MPNLLYTNDDFVPIQDVLESTPGKYLAFCDYGINEEDIIFADNNNLDLAINDIMQCTKTGLDSEFGGKNTKLDDEAKLLAVL